MKKIFSKEVVIGLCVLGALAILFIGIDFLKGVNVFKASNYYYVTYTDVQGLAVSAPVSVNGYKIGQVRDINYQYDNPGHVLVEISLDKEMKLPKGTKAVLSSDILGTATISLDMGVSKEYYNAGDNIEGYVPKGMMSEVSDNLLPSVSAIFPKIDSLITNLNTLVANPALTAAVTRLDAISLNLENATAKLNSTIASLPAVAGDIKNITGNFVGVSSDLTELSTKLKTLPVDSVMGSLQATTANLRALTEQLKNPNSTLGLLMNDPKLYDNLNQTVKTLEELFADIKANPKRYISIKLL
jgi:phospholipid/cholesterol/gamma-HCH transport system substrate-binding protein